MAGIRLFDVHRTWEDWLGICLAVLIGLSPWITNHMDGSPAMWNALIVALAVLLLAAFEMVDLQRWEETGELLLGLWLAASPLVFGYGGAMATWHVVLGAALVLLSLLELWQDWKLSDRDLAKRGQ
jgi:O-antigen/teichoic acid export membrane protein